MPRKPVLPALPPAPPAVDPLYDAVLQRLTAGAREDFVQMLARWTQAAPGYDLDTMEALRALAKKYPDRYMQGMTMVARMAGAMGDPAAAHGGTTIIAFVNELRSLSDAEVYRRARQDALALIRGVGSPGPVVGSTPAPSTTPRVIDGEKV